MPDINLLQSQKKATTGFSSASTGSPVLLWSVFGLVVIAVGIWGGLYWWENQITSQVQAVEMEIAQIELQVAEKKTSAQEAIDAQSALLSMQALLDEHVYMTQLWKEIGKTALKTSWYTDFSIATNQDSFVISGEVSDYTTLGKVLLGLATSDKFSNVELVSSGGGEGELITVAFEIEVTVDHDLLVKEKK